MPDWSQIRKSHFPALETCTYLNTAGGGPLCRPAAEAGQRYYREAYEQGDTLWDTWLERVETIRGRLAAFLHASPGEIAFLNTASLGLNIATELLEGPGDVLSLVDEFPSVSLPWLLRGHRVVFVDGEEGLKRQAGPPSRHVAVSHVGYRTGQRLDLAELGKLCRERELSLVVDATQSLGAFPIDVRASGIDALVFSGYKWMTAGYGIAALYLRKSLLESSRLPAAGWRSAAVPYELVNDRLELSSDARALELGHPPFAGIFALGGALDLIEELGIDAIESRVHHLTALLHEALDRASLRIVSPRNERARSGITMVAVGRPAQVAAELRDRSIFVSARGDRLRLSVHYYNDEEDIAHLMEALPEAASRAGDE